MQIPSAKGKIVQVRAINPDTVCHPDALLASALLTVGVEQHPYFPFEILEQEVEGKSVTVWSWTFRGATKDGQYQTADLIKWWRDPAWQKANPAHLWTDLHNGFMTHAANAKAIRDSFPRLVLMQGDVGVHIPSNATPARKQYLLDIVEGRIPYDAPFVEPAPAAA